MRRLYHISSVRSATITRREKRRVILADCAIALGIPFVEQFACMSHLPPVIFQILTRWEDYIVEGHRFDILEDIGCYPTVYNTPVGFFFVFVWPIVIGLISGVYGCTLLCDFRCLPLTEVSTQALRFVLSRSAVLASRSSFHRAGQSTWTATGVLWLLQPLILFALCLSPSGRFTPTPSSALSIRISASRACTIISLK